MWKRVLFLSPCPFCRLPWCFCMPDVREELLNPKPSKHLLEHPGGILCSTTGRHKLTRVAGKAKPEDLESRQDA